MKTDGYWATSRVLDKWAIRWKFVYFSAQWMSINFKMNTFLEIFFSGLPPICHKIGIPRISEWSRQTLQTSDLGAIFWRLIENRRQSKTSAYGSSLCLQACFENRAWKTTIPLLHSVCSLSLMFDLPFDFNPIIWLRGFYLRVKKEQSKLIKMKDLTARNWAMLSHFVALCQELYPILIILRWWLLF